MSLLIEAEISCPWCGEDFEITVDTSQGDCSTIEDCTVCCRPMTLTVRCQPGELESVGAERG